MKQVTVMIKQVLFLLATATTISGEHAVSEKARLALADHCLKEAEVTQEFVDSFKGDPNKEPTEDFYCYMKCVFAGMGILDHNGVINQVLLEALFQFDGECLKGVSKIAECSDMKVFHECDKK